MRDFGAMGRALLVALAFAGLAMAMTWPVAEQATQRFAGTGSDLHTAVWDLGWVERVVSERRPPLFTPYLFHPLGADLSFHSTSWTTSLFALPFVRSGGTALGWNVAFLLMTWLCCMSMFAWVRSLTGRCDAGLLAGAIYGFAPYRMSQAAAHPNFGGLAFIPLALWGVWRLGHGGGVRHAWWAALGLALTLLTGPHLFAMASFAVGLLVAWDAVAGGRRPDAAWWRRLGHLALAGLVLCGPLVWPFVSGGFGAAIEGYTGEDLQSNLLAFFLPSPWHPWWGPPLESLYRGLGQNRWFFPSLGVVPLLLTLAGLVDRRTRGSAAFWGFALAVFGMLCLGERLRVGQTTFDFWMPYRLVGWLPPIQMLRSPDRFNVLVITALAPAAAWGLVALQSRWPRRRALLAAIAISAVLFEYLPAPYPTTAIPVSPFLRELAARDDGLALLELPLDRQSAKIAMSRQWVHGRPLVGGMVARQPLESLAYIRGSALLRALSEEPAPPPLDCRAVPLRREYARLRQDGIGWVVLRHRSAGRRSAAFADYFPGPPYHRDALLTAWSLDALLAHPLPCDARPAGGASRS